MKEFEIIKQFFTQQAVRRKDVLLGIGDDCAVVSSTEKQDVVITTDTLVAGVHFPLGTSAKAIGHKAVAVNLSDIAAMGPGSMGPKLQYLSAWPEEALYEKVYDPYTANPISAMPAFGKNGWLSDSQIKAVVAYLKTIK